MLKKILPPSNRSVALVSKKTGVAVVTINNWLAKLKEGKMSLDEEDENPSSMRKKDSKKIKTRRTSENLSGALQRSYFYIFVS